jgi:TRAP-type C4-dicarboxylate transport system permease small subunit
MRAACGGFRTLVDWLVAVECWVAIGLFTITGVVMAAQIFVRRVLNLPFIWAEDLTVFLFVWITFLGAAVLYHRKAILAIDTVVAHASPRVQRALGVAVDVLVLGSLLYVTWLAWSFFGAQRGLGHKLGGATGIPSYAMTLSVVVGMATMLVSTAASLMQSCLSDPAPSEGQP